MKNRALSLLLAGLMCVSLLAAAPLAGATGDTGLAINEENFPDPLFRQYVADNFDTDETKGELSQAEIAAVKSITFKEAATSLQGLEHFTALEELDCGMGSAALETLDLSHNSKLVKLNCARVGLKSLTLGNNPALTTLDCGWNDLTSLDLSHCPALGQLNCFRNALTSLDLSKNAALTTLVCSENALTSLELSKNTALLAVDCRENKLTALSVEGCSALRAVVAMDNTLTSLYINANPELLKLFRTGTKTATAYYVSYKGTEPETPSIDNMNRLQVDAAVELVPATPAVVQGRSLSTEGQVGVNFYLELPEEFLKDKKASVKINGTAMTMPEPNKDGWYKFSFYIAAKEMRDKVTIQLFDGNGDPYPLKNDAGALCTAGYDFSAQAYFALAKEKTKDQRLLTLLDRMSEYGMFAQVHFNYNKAEAVITDAMQTQLSAVTKETMGRYADSVTTTKGSAITHVGTSLLLESETSIKHRFLLSSGKIGDYTFYVNGVKQTPVDEGSGYYAIIISNIAARDLDKCFQVQVKKGSELMVSVDNYSALSYVRRVVMAGGSGDQSILDLARSLYLYNQSAIAYFG